MKPRYPTRFTPGKDKYLFREKRRWDCMYWLLYDSVILTGRSLRNWLSNPPPSSTDRIFIIEIYRKEEPIMLYRWNHRNETWYKIGKGFDEIPY